MQLTDQTRHDHRTIGTRFKNRITFWGVVTHVLNICMMSWRMHGRMWAVTSIVISAVMLFETDRSIFVDKWSGKDVDLCVRVPVCVSGAPPAEGNLCPAGVQGEEGEHGDPRPWGREQHHLLRPSVQRRGQSSQTAHPHSAWVLLHTGLHPDLDHMSPVSSYV